MMHINDLPDEILRQILLLATKANEEDGETFTYGLTRAGLPLERERLTKYIRGPLSTESIRWDNTYFIRQVCSQWHEWALSYNFEHVLISKWRGNEKWANLSIARQKYRLYEHNTSTGLAALFVDAFGDLKQTDRLLASFPAAARNVRRLWFNGFHVAETDWLILSLVARCDRLTYLSMPWTVLRRGTVEDWTGVLNVNTGHGEPLHSLELTAVCLTKVQARELEENQSPNPLEDHRIDFSQLKRLKIFGNTLHKPICDEDLDLIARTACNLECLDLTNISTISVAGMLALVKASKNTLQVLEHSPRSDDGFYHPFPGSIDQHVCELVASLPQMRDLSMSVPYMCADLFTNHAVKWEGECQVRAIDICGCGGQEGAGNAKHRAEKLRRTFGAARELVAARSRIHHELSIELFFAGCIFEPGKRLVHGDFAMAQISSSGRWPVSRQHSTKGPYGTSGVYGKEEGTWEAVTEDEYLLAVDRNWISL